MENDRVTLITDRAQRLLAKYFPGVRTRAGAPLPEELRCRLAQGSPISAGTGNGTAAVTMVVRRGGDELCVRRLPGRFAGERLLSLGERLCASPQQFQSLGLTAREAEVASWLLQGKSNPEIAVITGLSARTVEKHLERIYAKLGVESRLAATLHLLRQCGSA